MRMLVTQTDIIIRHHTDLFLTVFSLEHPIIAKSSGGLVTNLDRQKKFQDTIQLYNTFLLNHSQSSARIVNIYEMVSGTVLML